MESRLYGEIDQFLQQLRHEQIECAPWESDVNTRKEIREENNKAKEAQIPCGN